MAVPKSITKVYKDGKSYLLDNRSFERANYTIRELTRAALRDVGKFLCKNIQIAYYQNFDKHDGDAGRAFQYGVMYKKKNIELQVGVKGKHKGFYGSFEEFGTSKIQRFALITKTVQNNIAEIVRIESLYLSALEDEAKALSLISEEEYEGNADE
jgi:hypothetical protein